MNKAGGVELDMLEIARSAIDKSSLSSTSSLFTLVERE